ncbi:acetylxylan esterase [Mucilaginibacter calamicampi]|uniref:Acetylxylan esterase n=1 Tax=Mucilaginibacter calamicampi TaxID=1302352 RepID=A0ABW2Z0Z5_9SPHI
MIGYKNIYGVVCLLLLLGVKPAFAHVVRDTVPAQAEAPAAGEVLVEVNATDKNAVFEKTAKFIFTVNNTTATDQVGKISWVLTSVTGEKLKHDAIDVKIARGTLGKYDFNIDRDDPGFYKVDFMINVSEYDDTLHKAFGIKPERIKSDHKRPVDFDAFWETAKVELSKVKPEFKCILKPELSTPSRNVYLIEMKSLGNVLIRGWLTEPTVKNKKFAVILGLPGYQIELPPIFGEDRDVAFISLNVRGQGNSRTNVNTRAEEYIVHHIEKKDKYVMRGVIMDCIRAIDFIYSRDELRHDKIFVKGGSMGGFLAMATASLDKRVGLCSAQSPIFSDIRSVVNEVEFPIKSIKKYITTQPGLTVDKILDNLDYYDVKNFAPNITCKVLMSIGLLDTYIPPSNDYTVFNLLKTNKRILIFRDLGHDVSPKYIDLELAWMHDEFGLFL